MASKPYPLGFAAALKAGLDWDNTSNWKVMLVKGTLAYNAAHDFLDDVAAGIVDGTSAKVLSDIDVTVAGTTVKVDATDPAAWEAVDDAAAVGAAILYYDTTVAGTSPIISFNDGTNLTTNGSNVTLTFNAAGIFTFDMS